MPLESCPTCGYALSIADSRCRNCVTVLAARPWFKRWDTKLLIHLALVGFAVALLIYRLFFLH